MSKVVGYCKECNGDLFEADLIEGYTCIYECRYCGYPNGELANEEDIVNELVADIEGDIQDSFISADELTDLELGDDEDLDSIDLEDLDDLDLDDFEDEEEVAEDVFTGFFSDLNTDGEEFTIE